MRVDVASAMRGASLNGLIANTPIVLLTAVPGARAIQREIGAIDVISKPVSSVRVTKIVERVCGAAE